MSGVPRTTATDLAQQRCCSACGKELGENEGAWFFLALLCAKCLADAKSKVGLD